MACSKKRQENVFPCVYLKCEPVGFHKRSHLSVVRLLKSFPDQPALRRAARWRTIPTSPQPVNTQPHKNLQQSGIHLFQNEIPGKKLRPPRLNAQMPPALPAPAPCPAPDPVAPDSHDRSVSTSNRATKKSPAGVTRQANEDHPCCHLNIDAIGTDASRLCA